MAAIVCEAIRSMSRFCISRRARVRTTIPTIHRRGPQDVPISARPPRAEFHPQWRLRCLAMSPHVANVQLDTVADVADALNVYIEMRVRPQPKGKRARRAPIEVLAA